MTRIAELDKIAKKHDLKEILVITEPNILAITGVKCDNAVFQTGVRRTAFCTDFRYKAAVRRQLPGMRVRDIRNFSPEGGRTGYECSITKARFDWLEKLAPSDITFIDISEDLAELRAVKTEDEIAKLRAAETLNCEIWETASLMFRPGMTERTMARIIRMLMVERGDGEAFNTIVSIGANAAECHHEPDDTVWDGLEPVLVDMGVKLSGFCSDLTRNIVPLHPSPAYRKIYKLVKKAHDAAIAAAKPGMTAHELDFVARNIIDRAGFAERFGHSLGHGVGYEIHEAPTVSRGNEKTILKPGMVFTIEPGIYLEGKLGVRIEDMILITEDGCEVLSR